MKRKVSKKSKRRLMTFGIFSIIAIVYFCITLIGYIYNYASLKSEENSLKDQLVSLQDEKKDLKIEIQKLNDPSYVIRYAKEKFLYSSEGEYVIKLNPTQQLVVEPDKTNNSIPIIMVSIILFALALVFFRFKTLKQTKKI